MKKYFFVLFAIGLVFAGCGGSSTRNSAFSKQDSISAQKTKDSLEQEMKKMKMQDSVDAAKKDTTKK